MDAALELHQRMRRGIHDLFARSKVCFNVDQQKKAHALYWCLAEEFDLTLEERFIFAKNAFNYAKVILVCFKCHSYPFALEAPGRTYILLYWV